MCFLFNVRMNHYSLPTFESFELVERLYRRTRRKTLISLSCCQNVWCKNLHMCVASRPIQWQQPKRLMDVLELLHTHSLTYSYWCWHHHHICHAILFWLFRDTEGPWMCVFFSPFCLYSWKGLKNTKHLMVIKVARKCIRLLAFRSLFLSLSMYFRFYFSRIDEKKNRKNPTSKQNQLSRGGLSAYIMRRWIYGKRTLYKWDQSKSTAPTVWFIAHSLTVSFSLGIDRVFVLVVFHICIYKVVTLYFIPSFHSTMHNTWMHCFRSLKLWFFVWNPPHEKKE